MQQREKFIWDTRFYCVKKLDNLPCPERLTCSFTSNHDMYIHNGIDRFNEKDMYVFQYTMKGFGALKIKDEVFQIPEQTGFIIDVSNPDISYHLPKENKDGWLFLFLVFHDSNNLTQSIINEYGHIYNLKEDGRIISNLLKFKGDGAQEVEISASASLSMVTSLLSSLINIAYGNKSSENAMLIRKVYQLIEFNINKPYNVEMLAGDLKISSKHLNKILSNDIMISPHKLIARTKMRRAAMLLKKTDLLIKEIAFRVGHEPGSHFARAFKNNIGMSPGEFRKKGIISF